MYRAIDDADSRKYNAEFLTEVFTPAAILAVKQRKMTTADSTTIVFHETNSSWILQ